MRAPLGPGLPLWLAVGLPQSLEPGRRGCGPGLRAGEGHCFAPSATEKEGKQIKSLTVIAGHDSLSQKGEHEQKSPVSKIINHPEYNRLGYMSSDIALLCLKHKIEFGTAVQPISLPHKDDKFEAGILCMTSGWCMISETSEHSDVLQVVELPIVDNRMCNSVPKGIDFPLLERTVMCASFPDGEENACQGDSGGLFVCRRDSGIWVLAGITSWRAGWTRDYTSLRKNHRRASLGIFSKVFELMNFITQNICTACRSQGTVLFGENGKICYPHSKEDSCSRNCLCMWRIMVPEDKIVLIKFTSLNIQNQVGCKVCGGLFPSPLLTETNEATVTLVSRTGNSGSSFELTFTAVRKSSGASSGCGSVAAQVERGTIHSADYSDLYPTDVRCHCFFHAPEKHIIKFVQLEFEDFITECSRNCVNDAVTIYPEEEHELAKLCGILNPTPIFSPNNMLVIHFKSDGKNNFQGFKARFTFCSQKQVRRTKHIAGHGDFDRRSYDSDIALIELGSPRELNSIVRLVCLPESTLFSSEICAATGWGSINEGTSPTSLQINNESKTLLRQQFPTPTPSTDSVSGPGPKGSKTTKFLRSSNQEHPGTWEDVILTKPGGILQIPRHSYRTTMSCHRKLSAPLHHIIRLDIINFQMKPTPLACQGHMWVYEGFGSGKKLIVFASEVYKFQRLTQCMRKLCGGNSPSLKFHGPLAMLIFTYNVHLAMEEFSLRYSFHISDSMRGKYKVNDKGCPLLDLSPVSSTEITSPNYPNIYPNVLNCTWTFYSKSGDKMKAVIKDFTTEESWNCEWDYFSIYDGPDQQSRLLAHLCGSKKEFVLISSGAYLTMNFKTDKAVGERGFKVMLEDIVQRHSQKSNMGTQLPINEIIVGSNTGKEPTQGTCGIPVVDPFLMQGFERNTHVRPAERGEPRIVGGIVGGRAAPARSWPWLVSLQHHGQHFCGGALIAKQWVLTPAPCNFSTVTDGLVIGRSFLSNTQNSDLIPAKAVYTHPGFAQFPSTDDLSLLQLEKPVQIGEFVSLICLPGKDDEINLLSKCMTAGWGITEPYQGEFSKMVQEAAVLLISSTSCRSYWGLDIKNTNICGGAAGSSSCMGDSGGPLQCAHNGQYQLIGIVSWGSRNCQPTAPTVFARISVYRDWIASVTGGEA